MFESVGDGVLAFSAAFDDGDGFRRVDEKLLECVFEVGARDEDDVADGGCVVECFEGVLDDGFAGDGGEDFVEAEAFALSGGEEDGCGVVHGWDKKL